MDKPTITYYAVAAMPDGRLGQLLVKRGPVKSQEWTGTTYQNMTVARRDLALLNGCK